MFGAILPRRRGFAHDFQRGSELSAHAFFVGIASDGQAVQRADINAGIAFNTQRGGEVGLDVAVEAAFKFFGCLFSRKAEFDFGFKFLQACLQFNMHHLLARLGS